MIGFFVIQSLLILRSVKSVHADGLKLTFFNRGGHSSHILLDNILLRHHLVVDVVYVPKS